MTDAERELADFNRAIDELVIRTLRARLATLATALTASEAQVETLVETLRYIERGGCENRGDAGEPCGGCGACVAQATLVVDLSAASERWLKEHDEQVGTKAILADRVLNYPEVRREAVEAFEATLGDPCASCHCPRGYHVSESHPAYLADGSECYCEKWLALKEIE